MSDERIFRTEDLPFQSPEASEALPASLLTRRQVVEALSTKAEESGTPILDVVSTDYGKEDAKIEEQYRVNVVTSPDGHSKLTVKTWDANPTVYRPGLIKGPERQSMFYLDPSSDDGPSLEYWGDSDTEKHPATEPSAQALLGMLLQGVVEKR
jgi:hypothetical protein